MNKQDMFINWICGIKGVRFPFFSELEEVIPPIQNPDEPSDKDCVQEDEKVAEE